MNDSTRRPEYVDIADVVSKPDLQCIGDDVVCRVVSGQKDAWQFYDNLKTGSRLNGGEVTIPVSRTIRHPRADEYWQRIQHDSVTLRIQFYPPTMHPLHQKEGFNPKWFCWETQWEMNHVVNNRIRFTSNERHFVDLPPALTVDAQMKMAAKAYKKSLVPHRGIFIAGLRGNAELTELFQFVTKALHRNSILCSYNMSLKCQITNGNTTIKYVEKIDTLWMYLDCPSELVKEVLDKYKCDKVVSTDEHTNCSIPGTFIYAAPLEKSFREVNIRTEFGLCRLTLDVTRDCEHACIRWKGQHPLLLDICIAMAALELPPYVLLSIVDFIDTISIQSHRQKIDLIHSVRDSIQRVTSKRTEQTNRTNKEIKLVV